MYPKQSRNKTMSKTYAVYILANRRNGTLYVGVTNDLVRRVSEHKKSITPGFTHKYKINKLVYFETTNSIDSAITREKQLKGGSRNKKIELVESINPNWQDLFLELQGE